MAREIITFMKVDVASLPEDCQVLWAELIEAKKAFKAALQVIAPQGKTVQFVEKYGELRIALASKATPKAGAMTLDAFLTSAQANGHAS